MKFLGCYESRGHLGYKNMKEQRARRGKGGIEAMNRTRASTYTDPRDLNPHTPSFVTHISHCASRRKDT